MIRSLAATLGFLTTIPVPAALLGPDLAPPKGMLWWWTPVGALLGWLSAVVIGWATVYHVPWPTCATVGVVLLVALSGGLHLDGFMDTCDGLGSRAPRERALEIMKDSRVGAFGVIGLVCLLLLKVAALAGLPPQRAFVALCLTPVAGRVAQVLALNAFSYARPGGGMGGAFFVAATPGHAAFSVVLALGLSLLLQQCFAPAMILTLGLSLLLAWSVARRLGGHTGDTVGAVSETAECIFLLACLLPF